MPRRWWAGRGGRGGGAGGRCTGGPAGRGAGRAGRCGRTRPGRPGRRRCAKWRACGAPLRKARPAGYRSRSTTVTVSTCPRSAVTASIPASPPPITIAVRPPFECSALPASLLLPARRRPAHRLRTAPTGARTPRSPSAGRNRAGGSSPYPIVAGHPPSRPWRHVNSRSDKGSPGVGTVRGGPLCRRPEHTGCGPRGRPAGRPSLPRATPVRDIPICGGPASRLPAAGAPVRPRSHQQRIRLTSKGFKDACDIPAGF